MDKKMFVLMMAIAIIFSTLSTDVDAKKFRFKSGKKTTVQRQAPPPKQVEYKDTTSIGRAAGTAAVGGFAAGAGVAAGQSAFSGDRPQKCDQNSTNNCQQQK